MEGTGFKFYRDIPSTARQFLCLHCSLQTFGESTRLSVIGFPLDSSDLTLFQGPIKRCGPFEYPGIVREAKKGAVLVALILEAGRMGPVSGS